MKEYRYPVSALRGDYLRALAGMLFTGLLLFGASSVPTVFVIVASIFLLFAGFGLQTWLRHMTMIGIEQDGMRIYGIRRRKITWQDLNGTKLKFFTMKRDRDSGWMELTLLTSRGKVKIDSSIDGFNEIAKSVAHAVESREIKIDETSVENFNAIDIQTKSPGLPDAAKRFDKIKPWQNDV